MTIRITIRIRIRIRRHDQDQDEDEDQDQDQDQDPPPPPPPTPMIYIRQTILSESADIAFPTPQSQLKPQQHSTLAYSAAYFSSCYMRVCCSYSCQLLLLPQTVW